MIHQTAREFLIQDRHNKMYQCDFEDHRWKWKHSVKLSHSHRILAEACLLCLSLIGLEDEERAMRSALGERSSAPKSFFHYSARNWAVHFRQAGINSEKKIMSLALKVCDPVSSEFRKWYSIWDPSISSLGLFPEASDKLFIASYLGLKVLILKLLEEFHAKDRVRHRLMALMLKRRAKIDMKDVGGRTLLWRAAYQGYEPVMRLLLEKGARVDDKDVDGRTPLWWAASRGHESVTRLLLEKKARADVQDMNGRTPLCWAVIQRYEAVAELLLEKGAPANAEDKDLGKTLLMIAANHGNEAMSALLLKNGADVDTQDECGMTALHHAAEKGNKKTTKLLLVSGANANIKNQKQMTVLHLMVFGDDEELTRLWLKAGADTEARDEAGGARHCTVQPSMATRRS